MSPKGLNRLQNLVILLLTVSAVFLFASLPMFGALSDRSLLELARDRVHRERGIEQAGAASATQLALPVRIVYTNDFARFGTDALTTLSDEFERAGAYLSEALGSVGAPTLVSESVFLNALRGKGLYFDLTAPLPTELFSDILGVTIAGPPVTNVRRILLTPLGGGEAALYLQDGAGTCCHFSTAVDSLALEDFLASQSGSGADFAFQLGTDYARLSPYTLVLSDPAPCRVLGASALLSSGGEETFLRRAGFNAHAENRFTESSGTVLVREASGALYLRPDGTVEFQGAEAAPDSIYFIPAAEPDAPTLSEAATAAQALASALVQDLLGDAALCLSAAQEADGRCELCFDLLSNGTPIRFADGSHALTITTEGQSVTGFRLKARRYALGEETAELLPVPFSAAIAGVWSDAELLIAYVDAGGEEVLPTWIAE